MCLINLMTVLGVIRFSKKHITARG